MEFIKSVKNKSLIIFLISVLFFFCFNCNVFATTLKDLDGNDIEIFDVPEEVSQYPYFYQHIDRSSFDGSHDYYLYVATSKSAYFYLSDDGEYILCSSNITKYRWYGSYWAAVGGNENVPLNSKKSFLNCGNATVYNNVDKTGGVYYRPLVTNLDQLTTVEQLPIMMTKVILILVPIGLVVFGISLLIRLIKFIRLRFF